MSFNPIRVAAFSVLTLMPAVIVSVEAAEPPSPKQVAEWIEQLDSDSYQVREQATQQLIESGPVDIEALEKVADQGSLEAASRAVRILQKLAETDDEETREIVLRRLATLERHPAQRDQAVHELEVIREARASVAILRLGGLDNVPQGFPTLLEAEEPTEPTKEVITAFRRGERKFTFLRLGKTWKGGNEDLKLLEAISGLRHLSIHGVSVTDEGVAHLHRLTGLQQLELYGSEITAEGEAALRTSLASTSITIRRGAFLGVRGGSLGVDEAGAVVGGVIPDSAAEAAGLQAGDVIVKIDGKVIADFSDLTKSIGNFAPRDSTMMEIRRGEEMLSKKITFGGWN